MANPDREVTIQNFKDAKEAFKAYLREAARPEHFLSVVDKAAPLRRMDGVSISPARQNFIGSRFNFNHTKRRWEVLDKRIILAENEMWQFLVAVLVRTDIRSEEKLSKRLTDKTEGLLREDVRAMVKIWEEYRLDQLDFDHEPTIWETGKGDYSGLLEDTDSEVDDSRSSSGESESSNHETPYMASSEYSGSSSPDQWPHNVTNEFHHKYTDFLSVGTSAVNGGTVWFAWRPLPGGHRPVAQFYNSKLDVKTKSELKIEWHAHLELDNFEGSPKEKGISRRDYCRHLIRENEAKLAKLKKRPDASAKAAPSPASMGPRKMVLSREDRSVAPVEHKLLKRRHLTESSVPLSTNRSDEPFLPGAKRPGRVLDASVIRALTQNDTSELVLPSIEPNSRSPSEPERVSPDPIPPPPPIIKAEPLTYWQNSRTSLRVSASNQPSVAPASVPFGLCHTMDELFTTLISEYDIRSNNRISRISATYAWNGKRHLLRRDRQEDWLLFYNTIRKAWEREEDQVKFMEDGCEIEMMVHVD